MTSDELFPPVRDLIVQHIRSMDHAEAVLLLAAERDRTHSSLDVAEQRRWPAGTATEVLEELATSGLAVRLDGGYRLASDAPDVKTMTAFADLYHTRPVTLVREIYSTPLPIKSLVRPRADDGSA